MVNRKIRDYAHRAKRFIQERPLIYNHPNDALAGSLSRFPVYATIDTLLGVPEQAVTSSFLHGLKVAFGGYSLYYNFCQRKIVRRLGDIYQRHAPTIDCAHSATQTFAFGMAVNTWADYTLEQAVIASTLRAGIAIPLGPLTRKFTDIFRNARGQPAVSKETQYSTMSFRQKAPRIVAMVALPLALTFGTIKAKPEDYKGLGEKPIQALTEIVLDQKQKYFND